MSSSGCLEFILPEVYRWDSSCSCLFFIMSRSRGFHFVEKSDKKKEDISRRELTVFGNLELSVESKLVTASISSRPVHSLFKRSKALQTVPEKLKQNQIWACTYAALWDGGEGSYPKPFMRIDKVFNLRSGIFCQVSMTHVTQQAM